MSKQATDKEKMFSKHVSVEGPLAGYINDLLFYNKKRMTYLKMSKRFE